MVLHGLARLLAAGERPAGRLDHLHAETVVPASLDETFGFFSDAFNLEKLTPPWLEFDVRSTPPLVMREGLEIEYRIVLHRVPVPWRSRIDVWEPGRRFVDRQIVGPYRWWRHEHRFEAVADGTRVIDDVEFLPRFPLVTRRLVRRDVERIFAYRTSALETIFS